MTNIDKGLLHRAFSVFLFNENNELLLQQRASSKITFPDAWTNSCCSHPLAVEGETGHGLAQSVEGAKRAAQRKLHHELGIDKEQVPLDKFHFLTRIHYKSASDDKWGEHESEWPCCAARAPPASDAEPSAVDYVLFIKAKVDLAINENEVQATQYVTPDKIKRMLDDPSLILTPWFKLLADNLLFAWWQNLDSDLEGHTDEQQIRRM